MIVAISSQSVVLATVVFSVEIIHRCIVIELRWVTNNKLIKSYADDSSYRKVTE